MIEPKDVVLGVLGAAAALGGLVLVFLGIIIAAYQSYPGGVPVPVVTPYRIGGGALFGAFALSLLTVAVCVLWLALGGPSGLYGWTIALFGAQLIAVLLSAGWTTRMVLWQ
ncbi:MAG: hypothetical protein E6J20_19725 [Chloroflexi bacterium]|nr:MAG: hypothetical protein E6J20_19725 [Chloroflexota bacterium]